MMKKRMFGTLLAFCLSVVLVGFVFCGTAKAHQKEECTGKYSYTYIDAEKHTVECKECGYSTQQYHIPKTPVKCTETVVCALCGGEYGPLGHHFVADAPVAPTCSKTGLTAGTHCDRCGLIGTAQEIVEKTAHTYDKGVVTKPSCNGEGYTTYTCKDCGYKFVTDKVKPLSHWYDLWEPTGDGRNSAPCKRDNCTYVKTTDCVDWEFALVPAGADQAEGFSICPVCGELSDGGRLELVEGAKVKAITGGVPAGDMVLRCGELENGEKVMCVAFEFDARLVGCTGWTEFTVPAELLEGYQLMLLDNEGGETEVEVETSVNKASFTLSFYGDAQGKRTPVRMLHLVPLEPEVTEEEAAETVEMEETVETEETVEAEETTEAVEAAG